MSSWDSNALLPSNFMSFGTPMICYTSNVAQCTRILCLSEPRSFKQVRAKIMIRLLTDFALQVYELIGSRWIDQGTAFCLGSFQTETQEAFIIARAESNFNDIILSTAIRGNDVYQRQQGALFLQFIDLPPSCIYCSGWLTKTIVQPSRYSYRMD